MFLFFLVVEASSLLKEKVEEGESGFKFEGVGFRK